jgi:DNA-binding HxlR family transcriptional regulator
MTRWANAPVMQSPTSLPRSGTSRTLSLPPTPGPALEGEIHRAFSEFRESAVRLAERLGDLSGEDPALGGTAREELHLVRAIFGKWSTDVLVALHSVPAVGFEELRRLLPGITPRVLSLKLKELEDGGMVLREVIGTHPPKVRYILTDRGWTVAWLAKPVLLYLRLTDPKDEPPRRTRTTRGTDPSRP